jgi:hypothetical protein
MKTTVFWKIQQPKIQIHFNIMFKTATKIITKQKPNSSEPIHISAISLSPPNIVSEPMMITMTDGTI